MQPQTTWDILGSAFKACWKLIGSQTERDAFLAVMNTNSPINAQVIGQADIGFWRILALYNDINNPLFEQHSIDFEEFTEGTKLALDRFHDVQMCVQEGLHDMVASNNDSDNKSDESKSKDEDAVNDEGKIMMKEAAIEAGLVAALGGDSAVIDLENIMAKTWSKEAEDHPESAVAELKDMVTPEFFKILEVSSKTNYLLEKRFNYTADSGEVQNVALLSARAMEFQTKEDEKEKEIDYSQPMKDPSLENPPVEEEDLAVVAQVEVLYDVEQIITSTGPTIEDTSTEDDASVMKFPAGKVIPRKSVLVGVFEGWLQGDPNGNKTVRWKLAFSRPAWEFPFSSQNSI